MKNSALNFFSLFCTSLLLVLLKGKMFTELIRRTVEQFSLDTVEVFITGEGFTKADIHSFKGAERLEWGILSDHVAWVQFEFYPTLARKKSALKLAAEI